MINTIIPTPKSIQLTDVRTTIDPFIFCNYAPWATYVDTLCEAFEKIYETSLVIGEGGIYFEYDASLLSNQYRYEAVDSRITLSASTEEGILYAIATLLQAIDVEKGAICAEKATIEDYPDKEYRTLMVDVARQWHPARTILKYIDICFFLMVKYLHLHFIDDQRYTLPSKAFPHITDGNRFYSYEEIAAMRSYANQRGVILVPEFEAPGHAAAMNRNYPDIFAPKLLGNEGTEITTEAGAVITAANIVNAGNPLTIEAIRTLLFEICELFPETPYIHIGGDEANIKVWNYCTDSLAYMKDNNIEDVYELYSDFVGRVAQMVLDMGRTPIVWEGFPKKGAHRVPKDTLVIAWESYYNFAPDLLADGFKIINASWQPNYIVPSLNLTWGPKEILSWSVYNWQHWWPNSAARLNPINVEPTNQVIGGQLCAWESTYEQEINSVMENLAALSERVWTVKRLWDDREYTIRYSQTGTKMAHLIQDI